jgi:hypothetical protein
MYLLRWKFDYLKRPPRAGMWDTPGTLDIDKACFNNKDDVIWAKIEGKNCITRETVVLAEINGADFMNFQWMANAYLRPGSSKPQTVLTGLKIVSRNEEIEVFKNGMINKKPLKNDNINFATFGR